MTIPCDRSFAWAAPGLKQMQKVKIFIPVEVAVNTICELLNVTKEELFYRRKYLKRTRTGGREITQKRQVAQYILYERCNISLKGIGDIFSLHHTSIMHSIRLVKGQIDFKVDNYHKQSVELIMSKL